MIFKFVCQTECAIHKFWVDGYIFVLWLLKQVINRSGLWRIDLGTVPMLSKLSDLG